MAHGLSMKTLAGKTAIVTGASRGIGHATALELASHGVNLVITARTLEALDETCNKARALGVEVLPIACDVAKFVEVEHAFQTAKTHFSSLDFLINNAGMIEPIASLEKANPEAWARLIEVNLIGVFHTCHAIIPHFLEHQTGVIINLSSGAAHQALEGWSAYCASKAGVAMLTRSIALEFGSRGIRSYGFAPGVVDTQMQSVIRASGINPVSQLPKEKLADPRDPARVIAWLCTPQASEFAGQELSIQDKILRQHAGLEALL
jgi:3-oxoacyl-[acyl-carrier protein] reductase